MQNNFRQDHLKAKTEECVVGELICNMNAAALALEASLKRESPNFSRKILSCALVCVLTSAPALVFAQSKGPVYGNLRYEDDYSFLANTDKRGSDPFNRLKKIPVGGNVALTFGGQYRFRFENDVNRRLGASTPQAQSFILNRVYLFAEMEIARRVRFFGEFKYARVTDNELPVPLHTHDQVDVQNLFAEFWLLPHAQNKLGLRAGRQELQFGKQRVIGPGDWVNSRRTFQGVRMLAQRAAWKLDLFAVRPVELQPEEMNPADKSQNLLGLHAQRTQKGRLLAAYYLRLKENDRLIKDSRGVAGDYLYHTLGVNFDGSAGNFDWTNEAAYQFGEFGADKIRAYMISLEGGYTLAKLPAKPRVGAGFDRASGDQDPSDGELQTFNQLFPTAHPFLGWADQVARQNIQAATLSLTMRPHARVSAKVQVLGFRLAQAKDAFYNAAGATVRRSTSGAAGKELGSELDAEMIFNCCRHNSIVFGYARFMPGDFIKQTGTAKTHHLFYVMVPVRF